MRFTVPDDGSYLLVAQSLSEDGVGAYTLVLVLHGRCYVGGSRWYARGPEVAGLRVVGEKSIPFR